MIATNLKHKFELLLAKFEERMATLNSPQPCEKKTTLRQPCGQPATRFKANAKR